MVVIHKKILLYSLLAGLACAASKAWPMEGLKEAKEENKRATHPLAKSAILGHNYGMSEHKSYS